MDGGGPHSHRLLSLVSAPWSLFRPCSLLSLLLLPLAQVASASLTAQFVAGCWRGPQDMPEEQQSVLLNPGWPSTMRDNMKPTPEQFENFVAVTEANGARL